MAPFLPLLQDRLIILFFALAANLFLLSRRQLTTLPATLFPTTWLRQLFLRAEKKLNRPHRSASDRATRGGFFILLFTLALGILGQYTHHFTHSFEKGWMLESALLAGALGTRLAYDTLAILVRRHADMSLYETRNHLSPLSPYDSSVLDSHGVFRQASESTVESFATRTLGHALWYLVLGLPGTFLYQSLLTASQTLGLPSNRHQPFGQAATTLFRMASALPNLLAGLTISAATYFTAGTHPLQASRQLGRHPLATLPLAVTAHATDTQLGGNKRYQDESLAFPWIGDGTAKLTDNQARSTLRLLHTAMLITTALLATLYLALPNSAPKSVAKAPPPPSSFIPLTPKLPTTPSPNSSPPAQNP